MMFNEGTTSPGALKTAGQEQPEAARLLDGVRHRLRDTNRRLTNIGDRVHGPSPEDDAGDRADNSGTLIGALGSLHVTLSEIEERLGRLEQAI